MDRNGWFTMELLQGVDFLTYVKGDPQQGLAEKERMQSMGRAETIPPPVELPVLPTDLPGAAPPSALQLETVSFCEPRLRDALLQLVDGLHALHIANKVHRDIKPHNVLVTASGRVVILDFGLVTDRAQADSAVVGTLAYMAPEQAAAEPAGPAADWYSVGVMLFEALTGSLPNQGGMLEVIAKQSPPPSALIPCVPPDLDALCSELLDPDASRRPQGDEILARLRQATVSGGKRQKPVPVPSAESLAFVGRHVELLFLHEAFTQSRSGHAALVLIEGESGVGKSALVHHFTRCLQTEAPDTVILEGRCYQREAVPYKAFDGIIDALSRYMKRLPQDKAAALLPRRATLLLQAFPVLGRVQAMADAPSAGTEAIDPKEKRNRVFAALRELLARLCERHPLVLSIDDLQWTDADSLALLTHLMSPPDVPPLLLLSTLRPLEEIRPEGLSNEVLRQLRNVKRIRLGPLSAGDACELAEHLLQNAAGSRKIDAKALAAEAGGHPLFLDELIHHAKEIPGQTAVMRLEDALAARIAQLDPPARHLLSVVAVANAPISTETAAHAARLDSDEFDRTEALLRVGHLIRGLPTGWTYSAKEHVRSRIEPYHDRVRAAVLSHLSPDQQRRYHQDLARAIESSGRVDPESLALHCQGAGEKDKAALYALEAAAQAEKALAFDHAAQLYEMALELGSFPDEEARELRARLAAALVNAGRGPEAAQAYLAAAVGAAPMVALDRKRRGAEQLLFSGRLPEGLTALQEVLPELGVRLPSTKQGTLLSFLLGRLRLRLRGFGYHRRDVSQIPALELLRVDVYWSLSMGLATANLSSLRLLDGIVRYELYALRLGEPYRVALALGLEAFYAMGTGSLGKHRVAPLLARAERVAKEVDSAHALGFLGFLGGFYHMSQGEWARGLDAMKQAEELLRSRCQGALWELASTSLNYMSLLAVMGRYDELCRRYPDLVKDAKARGDQYLLTCLQSYCGCFVCLIQDDVDMARSALGTVRERANLSEYRGMSCSELSVQVDIDLYLGLGADAHKKVCAKWSELVRSGEFNIPALHVLALWLRGRAALAAASQAESERERENLLRLAERVAKQIAKRRLRCSEGVALLLRAGIAAARGDRQTGTALAHAATVACEAADMQGVAAAARRRHGELLGGTAGQALITEAEAWMIGHQVKNPSRLTAMAAPGFSNGNQTDRRLAAEWSSRLLVDRDNVREHCL